MEKKEFDEMVAINRALGGKFDAVVLQIAQDLEFGSASSKGMEEELIPRDKFEEAVRKWINNARLEVGKVSTSKYNESIVHSDPIKKELISLSNSSDKKFVKMIYDKLDNATPDGDKGTITLNNVATAWEKALAELEGFFLNIKIVDKKDKNYIPPSEYKKIHNVSDVSDIIDVEDIGQGKEFEELEEKLSTILKNNIDKSHFSYIKTTDDFVKKENIFTTDLKDWAVGVRAEMDDIINDKQNNYLVFQSLLSANYNLIKDGDKYLDSVKTRICNAIVNSINGETTASVLAEAGKKEVNNVLADASFLRELLWKYYEPIQGKDKNIIVLGPTNFGKWIHESIKENLIQKFVDAVNPGWTTNGKGVDGIGIFISDLKGKDYPLSKTRLTQNFKPVLTRNKNGIGIDSLLYDELLKELGTAPSEKEDKKNDIEAGTDADKISVQTLDQIWQKAVKKVYTIDFINKYYKSNVHPQFSDYNLLEDYIKKISFEALPADHLIKEACYRSRFVPKPAKREPDPLPLPTPTPTPRHNQMVTFKKLPYDQLEIVLLKGGKELDSIPFYWGAPNFAEIGHGYDIGSYEILVRYCSNNANEPRTAEQKQVFKEVAKKENKQEGFLCIFNFANKKNSESIFEFTLPFIPRTAEIYTRLGNKLVETVEIKSTDNQGFFAFFTNESPFSPFHSIFEFFIRFDGAHGGDFYVTEPLIKSSIGSCAVKYTVANIYEPVSFIFPYDPVHAWLTYDNNPDGTEVSGGTSSTPIPSNNRFNLGKDVPGGTLYLHISGRGNGQMMKVMSKKVYKQYSGNEWAISLYPMDANLANNVDFQDLRHEALRAMGDWVDDFMLELNGAILAKFDKDFKEAQEAASKIDFWNVIDAVLSAIPVVGKLKEQGEKIIAAIDATVKIIRVVYESIQYAKGQVQEATLEGMLKEFNSNVIQQFRAKVRTSTRDEQENIISHFIEKNPTKNTNELSKIVYDGTYGIFPKPEDAGKKIKEQLDKM